MKIDDKKKNENAEEKVTCPALMMGPSDTTIFGSLIN
jgi:hypothetical protein